MMKKRSKIQIALMLLLMTALVSAGCQKSTSTDVTQDTSQETTGYACGESIEFEVIHFDDIPLEIKVEIESLIANKGFSTWLTDDGMTYLLVSSGEKPTGGYGIEVVSLADYSGEYKVLVGEGKPAADAMVPQVITYPHVVVKYEGNESIAEVSNETSESFERLSEPTVKLMSVTGEYQGQIDNSSIEVKVGDGYMVFRNYEFDTLLVGIDTGDTVTIQYVLNEESQNILYTIVK